MMNGVHQVYSEVNNISQESHTIRPKHDINNNGLRSCINAKNSDSELFFDRLPNEIVAKMLSYLPMQDLLRVSGTTPVFEAEARRVLKLLDGKNKAEVIFQMVAGGDVSALRTLDGLGEPLGGIIDLETGNTLLHGAINANSASVMDYLLKVEGVNVNAINQAGLTPLIMAVKKGQCLEVNALLNRNGIEINKSYNAVNSNGNNRSYGEMDFIFHLLEEDAAGSTALHFAVHGGDFDILDLICRNGMTDIDAVDYYGNTALMKAIIKKENGMVRRMLAGNDMAWYQNNHKGGLLLHIAIIRDNIDILPDLLGKNIDVNRCDGQGNTALHFAVLRGSWEAARLLLSCPGINIDAQNSGEWSAHKMALSRGNTRVARLIEESAARQHKGRVPVEQGKCAQHEYFSH